MQSLALSFFCCLHLLHLWCLCHLDLTRLQPVRGSCDTNHNPAFILLYQPHPLSLPLFSRVKYTLHCHSLFHPARLAPPLTPYPSSLGVFLFSLSQPSPPKFSLIRFGKPLASPFYPLPSTRLPASAAKHRLSIAKKIPVSSVMFDTKERREGEKKQNKKNHPQDPRRRECTIFNLLSAATSLLLSFNELKSKCLDQHV